jgi:uncharacterized membrane protein YphA (DoxX/SURF4 family)/peroxiredoxin
MSTAVLTLRLGLAAIFALAAFGKFRDIEGSRSAMREFGVPARAAATLGVLLPVVELATAVALVPAPTARWGAVAALALLFAFIAGIANALRHGEAPDCHCFGQLHSAPAGRGTLARNGVLAAAAALVVVEGPGPAIDAWVSDRSGIELVTAGIAATAFLACLAAAQLWLKQRELRRDLAVAHKVAAGVPPGIPLGSPAPGFSLRNLRGEIVTLESLLERGQPLLLAFVGPACPSCVQLLPNLARWQRTLSERVTIVLLTGGKPKENRFMAEEYGLEDVLVQERLELVDAYRIRGTPSAVIVTADGRVGSNPAESVFGIEPMLRLALRDGAGSLVEGTSVA